MNKLSGIIIAILMLWAFTGTAQQDAQYTQHQWNKMAFNPAYAGAREALSLQFLGRSQWEGLEGAPRTVSFTGHTPVSERVALGLSAYYDELGIENKTGLNLSYAYRIPMDVGKLSLGLSAGFEVYNADLASTLTGSNISDPVFMSDVDQLFNPNFGVGLFYYTDRFWAGGSVPHLINNELDDRTLAGTNSFAEQRRHYTFTTGYVFPLGANVKLRPSTLLKYVDGSPLQFDINASLKFFEKLWLGASYRTGDSYDFNLEYLVNNQLRLGYAYDLTETDLSPFNTGSHEILVGFDFNFDKKKIVTPRNIQADF